MIGAYNISDELIDMLKEIFPDKLPIDKSVDIEEVRFLQGQQYVIKIIESKYQESTENVYDE